MAERTELDQQIVAAAKEHFLRDGIRNTDMKQLALELGISRSTLYRHFANSVQIAFYVVMDFLNVMNDDLDLYHGLTGYNAFCLYVHRFTDRLCENLPMLQVIREFDTLYSPDRDDLIPPEEYSQYIGGDQNQLPVRIFMKGVADGSIRPQPDNTVAALAFVFTAMGLVERIMPREKIYIQEHGVARELIDTALDLELQAIRK